MGTWNIRKIYGNDLAMDIEPEVKAVFSVLNVQDGIEKILLFYQDIEEDEKYVLWFVIGDILWNHGLLNDEIKEKVNEAIEYTEKINEKCYYSSETIAEFKKKINSSQPKGKKIPKPKVTHSKWKNGDILAYKLVNLKYLPPQYDIANKYMLIHVVSVWSLPVSRILKTDFYDEFTTVMLFNWVGELIDANKLNFDKLDYLPIRIQKRTNDEDIIYMKGGLSNSPVKGTIWNIEKIGNIGEFKGQLDELKNGGNIQQLEFNLFCLEKDKYIVKDNIFIKK